MMIGCADGAGFRYEVMARSDGFLVQVFDRESGSLVSDEARLFRTAQAAFAFIDYSAALDLAAAGIDTTRDLDDCRHRFEQVAVDLADQGVPGASLAAWRQQRDGEMRRRMH
jgi:hypothetical protein